MNIQRCFAFFIFSIKKFKLNIPEVFSDLEIFTTFDFLIDPNLASDNESSQNSEKVPKFNIGLLRKSIIKSRKPPTAMPRDALKTSNNQNKVLVYRSSTSVIKVYSC